jgi:hypothetical protein
MESSQTSTSLINRAATCIADLRAIHDLAWPKQNDEYASNELKLLNSLIADLRTIQSDIGSIQSNKPRATEVSNHNVAALINLQFNSIEDGINKARKPAKKVGSPKEAGCLCWRSDGRSRYVKETNDTCSG